MKILLIDKERKIKNDRTWCFWEAGKGFFEEVVYRKWDTISFLSDQYSALMNISPYQYKMIRGIDFYDYCFSEIEKHNNIEIVYGDIQHWQFEKDSILLNINNTEKTANTVFNTGTSLKNVKAENNSTGTTRFGRKK